MNLPRIFRRFRHFSLPCLLPFACVAIPIVAAADDLECGSEVVTANDPSIPQDLALAVAEELVERAQHVQDSGANIAGQLALAVGFLFALRAVYVSYRNVVSRP